MCIGFSGAVKQDYSGDILSVSFLRRLFTFCKGCIFPKLLPVTSCGEAVRSKPSFGSSSLEPWTNLQGYNGASFHTSESWRNNIRSSFVPFQAKHDSVYDFSYWCGNYGSRDSDGLTTRPSEDSQLNEFSGDHDRPPFAPPSCGW